MVFSSTIPLLARNGWAHAMAVSLPDYIFRYCLKWSIYFFGPFECVWWTWGGLNGFSIIFFTTAVVYSILVVSKAWFVALLLVILCSAHLEGVNDARAIFLVSITCSSFLSFWDLRMGKWPYSSQKVRQSYNWIFFLNFFVLHGRSRKLVSSGHTYFGHFW